MTTIDDLRQTFFEESVEGLEAIETGLSVFHESAAADETVNAVFRGIHSIKGGAGVFGFSGLVGFAHVFETVLDRIRRGELEPSPGVVEVLQKANDTLSDLVSMARSGEPIPAGFDAESSLALRQLIDVDASHENSSGEVSDFEDIAFVPVLAADTGMDVDAGDIHVRYRAKGAQYDDGFFEALKFLRESGEIALRATFDNLPTLDALDPSQSYLECEGRLSSNRSAGDLRESLNAFDAAQAWSLEGAEPQAQMVAERQSMAAVPEMSPTVAPEAVPLLPELSASKQVEKPSTKNSAATTIRVDLDKIDRVINIVGELVISQTMLGQLLEHVDGTAEGRIAQVLEDVYLHTRELKNSVMGIRAQPVRTVFQRMSRLVRELSVKTGKRVRLETVGEGTEVDKTVIERLSDPLTHIIRNSMDHGIETPEQRIAQGKSDEGTITLLADQRSSRIIIEISDDGAGINPERVIKKARDQGLIPAEGHLTDDEINNLIFLPGFSTASGISEISGRGVGMDVVRRNVQELGGRISLKSTPGKGMTIQLALPLTLAVMDGMIVKVSTETYVMPISSIVECIRPAATEFQSLFGARAALRLRGTIVPLVYLGDLFDLPTFREHTDESTVIIIESSEGARLGVVVDQLCGHQQVVIKSIEENYGSVMGIAGATILGDGRVAFILDAERLGEFAKSPECAPTQRAPA